MTTLKAALNVMVLVALTFFCDSTAASTVTPVGYIDSYGVETTISTRFARTTIAVNILNDRDCAEIKSFDFRLPVNARVTDLSMSLSDGCEMGSIVKSVADAFADFASAAAQGRPSALLEACKYFNIV